MRGIGEGRRVWCECLYKDLNKTLHIKTFELLNGLLYVGPNSLNFALIFLASYFAD